MRIFVCNVLLALFGWTTAKSLPLANDSIYSCVFQTKIDDRIYIGKELPLYFENGTERTIDDIIKNPPKFEPYDGKSLIFEEPIVWFRFKLVNNTDTILPGFMSFCALPKNIDLYEIKNNKVLIARRVNRNQNPFSKDLISLKNHIYFSLYPRESKIFYTRIDFSGREKVEASHINELIFSNEQTLRKEVANKFSFQSLYLGLMLMFILFSLFMYQMFKDNTFVYFFFIQLSFILYFVNYYDLIEIVAYPYLVGTRVLFNRISVSFIELSVSLFFTKYISTKKILPDFHRFFIIFLIVVTIGKFLLYSLQSFYSETGPTLAANVLTIFWTIIIIAALLVLSMRKVRPAQNMLFAIVLLFITSIIFILTISKLIPNSAFGQYGIQFGTILFSLFVLYGLFEKINEIRNAKTKAEALDHLRTEFFTNISHEFRTPLTLIIGPIGRMLEDTKDSKQKDLLGVAFKHATRLQHLINQILDLTKLEYGKVEIIPKQVDLVSFLKGIVMSFESLADQKNIKLHFASKNLKVPVFIDSEKMEMVFYNLLSNAFKFTKNNEDISVLIFDTDQQIEVIIRDTGIGIANEKLPFIFDRFYYSANLTKNKYEGSGIGLAIVKQYLHLHSAKIKVESILEKGTTFTIYLKKGTEHFADIEISNSVEEKRESRLNPTLLEDFNNFLTDDIRSDGTSSLATILVIEDNKDVRAFIRRHLASSFQIEEAEDGEIGIQKAIDLVPQLIISDVMMPIKSGFEVVKELKLNTRTSHIPIILLSARAERDERIIGLELGADDYLIKPFDQKELEVRIRRLIDGRSKLRDIIVQSPTLSMKGFEGKPADMAFMDKLNDFIEKHYHDSSYAVEILAEQMGMSRVHLNRKLKAITNVSANKYIQKNRLNRALLMLENQDLSVAEVAIKTGFSSPAYFVKCFRETFGQTPGSLQHK